MNERYQGGHGHSPQTRAPNPLGHTVQEQARLIAALESEKADLASKLGIFEQVYRNPPQQRAGVIEYPGRIPFLYNYRQELRGANDAVFGTAALASGKVWATFQLDSGKPIYLPRIQFALIRTAHNTPSATIPLNTYLPLAGMMPNGAKGLDFRWKARSSKGDTNWQSDWMDSSVFDLHKGYELPIENPLDEDSVLTIEAESWGSADSGNNEAFALFVTLHAYKMRAVEQ